MLVLLACGGQSGENGKGGDSADTCGEPTAEVPEGLTALIEVYDTIDGSWSATLRCQDAADEEISLAFTTSELAVEAWEGECPAEASGTTDVALVAAAGSTAQVLVTHIPEAGPIDLSGEGVHIEWSASGPGVATLDSYLLRGGSPHAEPDCSLVDLEAL